MKKNEYLVVIPVADIPVGSMYQKGKPLPPHCTVMQWFPTGAGFEISRCNRMLSKLARSLRDEPIKLESSHYEEFGPNHDVPVHVLERSDALNLFHTKLFLELANIGSVPYELQWAGAGFRPHVANVGKLSFSPGQLHIAKEFVLVVRGLEGDKKVIFRYPIGPSS